MAIAQTCASAVAAVCPLNSLVGTMWTYVRLVGTVQTYVHTVTTMWTQ